MMKLRSFTAMMSYHESCDHLSVKLKFNLNKNCYLEMINTHIKVDWIA